MPAATKRGTAQGKAARNNFNACDGPVQTRSQRRRQLLNDNENENACGDA